MTRRDLLQIPTAASLLKGAGYRTALFGKWGLGGPGASSVPNTRGFGEFYGYLDQQHDFLYWEFHENRFAQAIRTAADPGERTSIADKSPGLVRRAEELFRTARTDSPLFPVKPTRT